MKASKHPAVAAVALLMLGSGAMAQQGPFASACGMDVKTFCADVKPDEGRIRDCVRSHIADLSAPCKDILSKEAAIGPACKDDVKTVCADVKPATDASSPV